MVTQSNVEGCLRFLDILFIAHCTFHQVDNIFTFAVQFLKNLVVDIAWLQHKIPVFYRHGNIFYSIQYYLVFHLSFLNGCTSN